MAMVLELSTHDTSRIEETFPKFTPQMTKHGCWFVAVQTGAGPNSHIEDFETKDETAQWIATKSKYWPSGGYPEVTRTEKAEQSLALGPSATTFKLPVQRCRRNTPKVETRKAGDISTISLLSEAANDTRFTTTDLAWPHHKRSSRNQPTQWLGLDTAALQPAPGRQNGWLYRYAAKLQAGARRLPWPWQDYLPRCTDADFVEHRRQRPGRPGNMPSMTPACRCRQTANDRARYFGGSPIDSADRAIAKFW
jgi:hypothetical protein